MKLSTDRTPPGPEALFVARSKPWPYLALTLGTWASLAALGAGLVLVSDVPWPFWVVIAPVALATALILGLLASSFRSAFCSARRPTNWWAAIEREALRLNLRDHRNAHLGGDDPTTVRIAHTEITSIGRLTEVHREEDTDGRRTVRSHWLAITLNDGVCTEDLELACMLEATREAPATERFGVTTRTRHHAVTVRVDGHGRVLVRPSRAFLAALSAHHQLTSPVQVDLDEDLGASPSRDRAETHLRRGLPISATRELRRTGASLEEARDQVRSLTPRE